MEILLYLLFRYITVVILIIILYLCLLYLKHETLKKGDSKYSNKNKINNYNVEDIRSGIEKLNNSIKGLRKINTSNNKEGEKINIENLESKLIIENIVNIKDVEPNLEIEKQLIDEKEIEKNNTIEIDSINNSAHDNQNYSLAENFLLEEEVKDFGKYIISVKEFRDLIKCKDKLKKLKKSKRCTKKMIDYLDKEMKIKCEEMNLYFDNYYNRIETIKQASAIVNNNQDVFVSNTVGIAVSANVIEPKIIVKDNSIVKKTITYENVLKKENIVVGTKKISSLNIDVGGTKSEMNEIIDIKKKFQPELITIAKSSDVEVMQSNGKLRVYTLPKKKSILKRISNYFTQKVSLPLKLIYLERILKRDKEEKRKLKREKDIERIRLLKVKLEKTKREEHNAKIKTKREKAKQKTLLEKSKKKIEENSNRSMW